MARYRKPGPLGRDPFEYDDDFIDQLQNPPGSGNFAAPGPFRGYTFEASPFYEGAKREFRSRYASAGWSHGFISDYEGARCILQAAALAHKYVPAAIFRETGYELTSLLKGLIPGLLQMLAVVGATTSLGGLIGAAVGALAGGVGSAPGAVVGGELGFDLGLAVLTWLGLAFLAVSIAKGFAEMAHVLHYGLLTAWWARDKRGADEEHEVERAAQDIALAVGILMRLILQAVVAYLLKKAAVGSTRAAVGTIKGVQAAGASAVSEATVAELVGKLRASRLGKAGFADWVQQNWRKLVDDPRLRETAESPTKTPKAASPVRPRDPLRSKQSVLGQSDGGPGKWVAAPKRSGGIEYQEQVSGVERGAEYEVNGVKFDGYDAQRGVLIDAKDWSSILQNADPPGSLDVGWPLQNKIFNDAIRQLNATNVPIEWQFSDEASASAVQKFFEDKSIPIDVVFMPKN